MSDELKKYLKYPVIIPVFEVERERKDYLQIKLWRSKNSSNELLMGL